MSRNFNFKSKPGDWTCPTCRELNFAKFRSCRKCNTAASGSAPATKPGDWNCACGELNFARNQTCRKCYSAPGSVGNNSVPAVGNIKPGDWKCACGELNFARNQTCRKCNSAPGLVGNNSVPAGLVGNNSVPAGSVGNIKPGDWKCACGELNFARNQTCRKCNSAPGLVGNNSVPADSVGNNSTPPVKPGDWICLACCEHNFARNRQCRRCNGLPGVAPASVPVSQAPPPPSEEDEEKDLCLVCMVDKAAVVIVPCVHLSLCKPCSDQLNKCPVCRADYSPQQVVKVYNVTV